MAYRQPSQGIMFVTCGGQSSEINDMESQKWRIQPPDLRISEDDPFASDRLGRKESAEVLTRIVSRIEGPCVLALDAPWGYGKTTFLTMWAKWLRREEQGFPVVAFFNAWETDFTNQPFLAMSSELTKELEASDKTASSPAFDTFKKAGKNLLRVAVPVISQLAESLIPVVGSAVGVALSAAVSDESDTNDYQEAKKAIAEFKAALGKLAQELGSPLVIMIDELDRCRPSYAVELLEVAKHLFAVDNVVFVLAVNRAELVHSIKALYGTDFDSAGYLRRFFDLDFQLPEPSREQFVQELLKTTKLTASLQTGDGQIHQTAKDLLEAFLGSPELSLRDIQQAAHRLGLVLAALPEGGTSQLYTVIAIILRTANFSVYQRFVSGVATEREIVDTIFSLQGTAHLRSERNGFDWWLEAEIILGILAMRAQYSDFDQSVSEGASPLLDQYRMQLQGAIVQNSKSVQHAKSVVERVESQWTMRAFDFTRNSQAFIEAAKQLEFLSPELGQNKGI